jgi:hypothetical protein
MNKHKKHPHNHIKGYIDRIIETLVYRGIAGIDTLYFNQVRRGLEGKLRGQVLFHSDLKSRTIFITYKKVKQ